MVRALVGDSTMMSVLGIYSSSAAKWSREVSLRKLLDKLEQYIYLNSLVCITSHLLYVSFEFKE